MAKYVRICHRASQTTLAEGPVGWGITPFEGNYYISPKVPANDWLQAQLHSRPVPLQVSLCLAGSESRKG